ncbi:MAG: choice-of-anchor Q domain-containing protein [Vicinamibacterales bacterium]
MLLVAVLASPAAAQTTHNVANVAQLAAEIASVNAGAGGDLIVLAPGSYVLTAPLVISRDVTILGNPVTPAVIEGDGSFTLLDITANHVSLLNLTIRNGLSAVRWAGFGAFSATGLTITGSRDGVDAGEGEGEISITNSTISDNSWSGVQMMCPANLHVTNATVSGNDIGLKILAPCNNVIQLTNTLIVGNTTSDCGRYAAGFQPDGATSIDSDGSCVSRGFPGMATLPAADIDLSSLANHGGPTWTQAIAATSAAVNAGTNTGCPATDQRGVPRDDGSCDIGAYEASAAPGNVYFVATPAELETAISDARDSVGRDRIYLAATAFPINSSTIHTVRLFAFDFTGPNDITLIGAGAAFTILEGGGLGDRNDVVNIGGNSLMTIEKMTIQNGGADGIYNNGNLVLRDSIVRNHGRTGIESVSDGLAIFGSTISGNGAALNGGWGEAGIYVESTFSAVNSTIAGNQTAGIFVDYAGGGASLTNVTIDGNVGAGLAAIAPITLTNTIVADNAGGDCDPSFQSGAVSGGNNLIGDSSCGFVGPGEIGGSPQLGPLQDNGGATPTMALGMGSPAIDAGGSGACPVNDQRAIGRPQGAACDIGAFELEQVAVNGVPTCVDFSGSTSAATPLSGAVVCSDPDAGDTFTVLRLSGPSHGTVTVDPDGTFTYTPASGFIGTDSFLFQATDSLGAVSIAATATIQIVNRAPTCQDFSGSVHSGAMLAVGTPGNVLCSDPDGDAIVYEILSGPGYQGGIPLSSNTAGFVYNASSTYVGADSFTYRAKDSYGAFSNVATATIQIVNQAPTCQNFSGSVLSGAMLAVGTPGNVLCSDPDGDGFVYVIMSGPAHQGSVPLSSTGFGFLYNASSTYVGADSFTYTARDSYGAVSNIATATLDVIASTRPPFCRDFSGWVYAGWAQTVGTSSDVLCSDPDGDAFTYAVVMGPAHGTLMVTAGGFTYTPSAPYFAGDSFTYQATDSHGAVSNVGTATIQIVNTLIGQNVLVTPVPAVALTFSNILTAGTTTAVSSPTAPPMPAGFQVPGGSLYWEIATTASYTPPIEVCIAAPTGVTNPRLLHYQGGAWVDVTSRLTATSVCGNVTSLSPFVVAVRVPAPSVDVAAQLRQLEAMVNSFNLRKPVARRFVHRLDEVQEEWRETRHHQKNHTKEFCKELDKFMRDVQKATGKTLTAAEAGQVLALAQLIAGEVGCGP